MVNCSVEKRCDQIISPGANIDNKQVVRSNVQEKVYLRKFILLYDYLITVPKLRSQTAGLQVPILRKILSRSLLSSVKEPSSILVLSCI